MILEITSRLKERDLDPVYLRVKIDGEEANRCLTDLAWSEVLEWAIKTAERKAGENGGEMKRHVVMVQLMTNIAERLHEALRALGDGLDVYTSRCDRIPEDAQRVEPGSISIVQEHTTKVFEVAEFSGGAAASIADIEASVNRLTQQINDVRNVLCHAVNGAPMDPEFAKESLAFFDLITGHWLPQMMQSAQMMKKIVVVAAQSKAKFETETGERTIDHHCPVCNAPVYNTHPIGLCSCEWPEHKIEEYSRLLDEFSSKSEKVN